jgi:hypothetical protein
LQSKETQAMELDSDSIFKESLFEHTDAISNIEKNFKNNTLFLTAGKDALVNVWKFTENDTVEF